MELQYKNRKQEILNKENNDPDNFQKTSDEMYDNILNNYESPAENNDI